MPDVHLLDETLLKAAQSLMSAVFSIRCLRVSPLCMVESISGIADNLGCLAQTIDIACEGLSDASAVAAINMIDLVQQTTEIDAGLLSILLTTIQQSSQREKL